MPVKKGFTLNAARLLALGFAGIILVGALLLCTPAANRPGLRINFIDALFTATSATCVTGLVVVDTWSQFTVFGQVVILLLIQIGGLGFMTFAILFSVALGRRIGLRERTYMMEAVGSMQLGGIVRLAKRIVILTLAAELLGAVLLSARFIPVFGWKTGVWFGVFHSISAFCNAGFDLMGRIAPYASLTPFVSDATVSLTVSALIVAGGLGFIVWDDLVRSRFRFRSFSLHTKVVLTSTAALIALSAGLLLITERDASFAGLDAKSRVLAAIFQAITPRTAGFNTVDTAATSSAGTMLTIFLMFIGAAPGSTGGGVKISTFAVLAFSAYAYMRSASDVNAFGRRFPTALVKKATMAVATYIMIALGGAFLLLIIQPLGLRDAVFEAFSALGTVGLTMGITRLLSPLSRIIVIILMFSGRVGSLTVFIAVARAGVHKELRNPRGDIIVGC